MLNLMKISQRFPKKEKFSQKKVLKRRNRINWIVASETIEGGNYSRKYDNLASFYVEGRC